MPATRRGSLSGSDRVDTNVDPEHGPLGLFLIGSQYSRLCGHDLEGEPNAHARPVTHQVGKGKGAMVAAVRIARGKFDGINACAGENGVISAAAMDQRGSLQKSIGKARDDGKATAEDLATFKKAVVSILTPHASAILIDHEF